MAYSEELALRIRSTLQKRTGWRERTMFGGLTFLLGGHMFCRVFDRELVVRVGPDAYEAALAEPHARPMVYRGKPQRGIVSVGEEGLASDGQLAVWVERGWVYARSLPPKER